MATLWPLFGLPADVSSLELLEPLLPHAATPSRAATTATAASEVFQRRCMRVSFGSVTTLRDEGADEEMRYRVAKARITDRNGQEYRVGHCFFRIVAGSA